MIRFGSPLDGDNKEFHWERAKGQDSPELNADLPESIRDHFQNAHAANLENANANEQQGEQLVPREVIEELQYLASLPLAWYDDDEGLQDNARRRVFRAYGNSKLSPNHALRSELEADLALVADAPRGELSKHWMLAQLVSAYLVGRYQPDASRREDVQYELQRVKFSNLDEDSMQEEAQAVLDPYRRLIDLDKQAA